MPGLRQDLRFAIRTLSRQPGFTVTAVLILGFAIAATTTIYSVVDAVLLRPLPYGQPERVVVVHETLPETNSPFATAPANFLDWREMSGSFEAMAAIAAHLTTFTGEEGPERLRGQRVSADFFRVLGVQPALGRDFLPEDEDLTAAGVVILSHDFWQHRLGGDPEILGRTVPLGGVPRTVIGVMPPSFLMYADWWNPEVAGFWTPDPFANNPPAERGAKRLRSIARLAPGVTVAQAGAEMTAVARALEERHPETNEGWGVAVVPLQEMLVRDVRSSFLLVLGAVAFVLLIACANVATLLLARSAGRRREIAIRAALGAGRARVFRQLLTESAVLAVLGLAVGLVLAFAALPALLDLAPASLPRLAEVGLDWRVLAFAVLLAGAATLLFGVLPSLQASREDVRGELVGGVIGAPGSLGGSWGRKALVAGEVALSVILLAGAGLMVNSFLQLRAVDMGVDRDEVVLAELRLDRALYAVPDGQGTHPYTEEFTRWRVLPERGRFVHELVERVAALPGVTGAAAVDFVPGAGGTFGTQFAIEGRPPPEDPQDAPRGSLSAVTPGYFEVMGIPLLRGRAFTAADGPGGPGVAIVSAAAARRHWPDGNPIGARILLGDGIEDEERAFEVVGVVGDILTHPHRDEVPEAHAYIPQWQRAAYFTDWQIAFPNRFAVVARATGDVGPTVAGLRQTVWSLNPEQPIHWIGSLSSFIYELPEMAEQRFYTVLLGLLSGISVLLAVGGLYGVISFLVTQRTYEIGVRMALGARREQVLRLVLGQSLKLVLVGVAIGLAGAAALTRMMESWLFGVDPRDPGTYAAIAGLLVAAALLASFLPARRAADTDPMMALRAD